MFRRRRLTSRRGRCGRREGGLQLFPTHLFLCCRPCSAPPKQVGQQELGGLRRSQLPTKGIFSNLRHSFALTGVSQPWVRIAFYSGFCHACHSVMGILKDFLRCVSHAMHASLPEFMDFKLSRKTILVANEKLGFSFGRLFAWPVHDVSCGLSRICWPQMSVSKPWHFPSLRAPW